MTVGGSRAVVTIALAIGAAGCAHRERMPTTISGAELAPGIHAMPAEIEQVREFRPWEPSVLYPSFDDAEPEHRAPRTSSTPAEGPVRAAAWLWFRAYQATLSRVDGTTCRFRPTCSGFGIEAVREHGLLGVILTFGRLHRSHADEKHYPMTNPPFLDDPVSNYTFWLREPRLDDFAAYDDESHAWYQHVRATRRLR